MHASLEPEIAILIQSQAPLRAFGVRLEWAKGHLEQVVVCVFRS